MAQPGRAERTSKIRTMVDSAEAIKAGRHAGMEDLSVRAEPWAGGMVLTAAGPMVTGRRPTRWWIGWGG